MRSRHYLLPAAIALFVAAPAHAGDGNRPASAYQIEKASLIEAPSMRLPPLDRDALAATDALTDGKGRPWRFARPVDVMVSTTDAGRWTRDADGERWTLAIDAGDAVHLNFGFSRFDLPPGAQLRVFSPDGSLQLGPYTHEDELPHGQWWTPLMPGGQAVLVLDVPTDQRGAVDLVLQRVGQGYRGFGAINPRQKSGSCNMDVACLAAGDPWNAQRRSVARLLIGGAGLCTGGLINNTANNRRMLLSTASHCGITAANGAQVVALFNYESASCRTPGSAASGTVVPEPSGGVQSLAWIAGSSNPFNTQPTPTGPTGDRTDWTLIELSTPPNLAALNVHWAGWTRSATAPTCSVPAAPSETAGLCASIHHPSGDEKRITFAQTNMTTGNIATATQAHWNVAWDPNPPLVPGIQPPPISVTPGVTEPGSSGSPLFDSSRRIVGVLSGGPSFCGATGGSLADLYGKLSIAFSGTVVSGSPTIASVLDPGTTGAVTLDGIDVEATTEPPIFANGFES
ncbi:trypsin-like serine peptidase [Aquimonas sp.]|uniref:trypsin-like serine peptidase n=1 Tax=Aquimonas sp. TaxID=1872588 RepID=UPI0037BE6795